MDETYTREEQQILLGLARQALVGAASGSGLPVPVWDALPPALRAERACFVTLRNPDGTLRGCTGALVASRPLAEEVIYITAQTALTDPRFYPVTPDEVPDLHLEISVLTAPERLIFNGPDDLIGQLQPGVHGVTLRRGARRATFLPQVWESYPEPRIFLSLLSKKMGGPPDDWKYPGMTVEVYRAIVIEEPQAA